MKRPAGLPWRVWITDHIKKAGEDANLVQIQPEASLIAIYPKWAPNSVFNDDNMKAFNPVMKDLGARWNQESSRWTINKTPEDVGWAKSDDVWTKGDQIVEVYWTDVEVAWVEWRNNIGNRETLFENVESWDDAVDYAETWILENPSGRFLSWENPQDGYLEKTSPPKGAKVVYITQKELNSHNQLVSADIMRSTDPRLCDHRSGIPE